MADSGITVAQCAAHHWHIRAIDLAVPEKPTCGVTTQLHADFVCISEVCCRCQRVRDVAYGEEETRHHG